MVPLYPHQREAVDKLASGSILCGGVGTGKSRTSLAFFVEKLDKSSELYIITTARKRDLREWEKEAEPFGLKPHVDSWNNIGKYGDISGAFFVFDEQRVVGSGEWVKSFLKITKSNKWLLLSATPGDDWMDYIPVMVANGYYRNRTEFIRRHVVFKRFCKYPKVERYLETERLEAIRKRLLVTMPYQRKTVPHHEHILLPYNQKALQEVMRSRWDPYKGEPIKDAGGLCYVMRRIVNEDDRRVAKLGDILKLRLRVICFYNYDYELEKLKTHDWGVAQVSQWNGHVHQPIPDSRSWLYLVQYTAGAEGWNCTETDTIVFYSQSYSYKATEQAAGRIDRLNTPFTDLYYYHFLSGSFIDQSIYKALSQKKNFNEKAFCELMPSQ